MTIVGGLATMPSRGDTAPRAIASILPQVDRLELFLDRFDDLPDFVRHPKVRLHRSQDVGEIGANGKLLGLAEARADDLYVCFDDDNLYPAGFVRWLRAMHRLLPGRVAVGMHGGVFPERFDSFIADQKIDIFYQRQWRPKRVDLLATNGCLFRAGDLRFDVLEWTEVNMVDLNFTEQAIRHEVGLWTVPRRWNWVEPARPEAGRQHLQRAAEGRLASDRAREGDLRAAPFDGAKRSLTAVRSTRETRTPR